VLESNEELTENISFPNDPKCSRTVHFDDGEILCLSLPTEREVGELGPCPFGYWRRIGAHAETITSKKRATAMTDFFPGVNGSVVQNSKKSRGGDN
jgi:hypothetical protein